MKKKYRILLIILMVIGLYFAWVLYNVSRVRKCCDYTSDYNKAIEIIQKIEFYRMVKGKLPESLNDIGEVMDESGPIYYNRIDSVNYDVWFTTFFFESCVYHSETRKWTPD